MKNIIQILKSINIKQVVTVFLAGCLVFVSTACSQDTVAQDAGNRRETNQTYQGKSRDTYDEYDANQNYKDSFNGYNDDRRYDSEAAAKAQTLVDTAKRRKADNLGEFADNVGERSVLDGDTNERALGKFSDKVERNVDKAGNYIDKKSDKLGRNLKKVPGGVEDVVEGAVDNAKNAADDAAKATKTTAKNIKSNVKDVEVDLD